VRRGRKARGGRGGPTHVYTAIHTAYGCRRATTGRPGSSRRRPLCKRPPSTQPRRCATTATCHYVLRPGESICRVPECGVRCAIFHTGPCVSGRRRWHKDLGEARARGARRTPRIVAPSLVAPTSGKRAAARAARAGHPTGSSTPLLQEFKKNQGRGARGIGRALH
jgi:hypothetical protein